MAFFLQLFINGILSGGIYSLMALAIVVVYKSSSVFNFAHGALVALSSFMLWQLTVDWQLSIWLSIPLLLLFFYLLAFLIQKLVLQPLTGQSMLSAVMATIAMGEVFGGIGVLLWPGPGRVLPQFFKPIEIYIGPAVI